MNELKNLQTHGLTLMGPALKHAFDLLNINRMQTGIDTYGQVSIDDRWKKSQVYEFRYRKLYIELNFRFVYIKTSVCLNSVTFSWDQVVTNG